MGNYHVYLFGQWLMRVLPPKAAYALAVFISDIHYVFSKADRAAVRANLEAVTGKDVPDEMVREVFRNFGRYLVDFFTMTKRITPEYIKDHIECVRVRRLYFRHPLHIFQNRPCRGARQSHGYYGQGRP